MDRRSKKSLPILSSFTLRGAPPHRGCPHAYRRTPHAARRTSLGLRRMKRRLDRGGGGAGSAGGEGLPDGAAAAGD
jgi:hypothetical protein